MSFLFELISSFFESISLDNSLNTNKIDGHIDKLKKYSWFKDLYEDEKYHRLFILNRNVRKYLQSRIRVKRIIKSEDAKRKFISFLNQQI
jgi:hypothetical protein